MKVNLKTIIIYTFFIFFNIIHADYLKDIEKSYITKNWEFNTGFPTNNANDILQDKEEYIWITTYDGLIRFNGKDFKIFNKHTNHGFHASSFTFLFEDSKRRIWIGTNKNELALYKNKNFLFFNNKNGFYSHSVRAIQEDKNGNILVGCIDGLNKLKENTRNGKWTITQLLKNIHITNILTLPDGKILLINNMGKLLLYYNNNIHDYLDENSPLKKYRFQTSALDYEGNIWLGTVSGKIIKLINKNNFITYKTSSQVYSINKIKSIKDCLNQEIILFCSDKGVGVLRPNSKEFKVFDENKGLINNSIENILIDKEFNIWLVSKRAGLQKLSAGKFSNITTASGLVYKVVNAILEDSENSIWIGTNNGLSIVKNEKILKNKFSNYFKNTRIRHIFQDSYKNIWISTYSKKGIIRIKGNQLSSINTNSGLSSNKTRVAYEDSKGYLWIGTSAGLNLIKKPNQDKITIFNKFKNFSKQYIMCISEDKNGNILVGTDGNGIYIIDNDFNIKNISNKDGLAGNIIFKIFTDSEGNLWVATGEGVSLWRNNKFYNLNIDDGFLSDSIYQIIEDNNKTLWLTSSKGIFSVKIKNLIDYIEKNRENLKVDIYNISDGFLGSSTATSWGIKDHEGKIWFPTLEGISVLDQKHIDFNTKEPKLVIEEISIDGKKIDPNPLNIIPPGTKRIKIKFAALSFRVPQKVKFKYYLEGFDLKWSEESNENEAVYTNLPYGHYNFYIKASNNDGVWNEKPYKISFYRKPYFHETKLFHFFILAVAVILTIIIFNIRLKKANNKKILFAEMIDDIITALTSAIDAKDSYTKGHSMRVAEISEKIAIELGIKGQKLIDLKHSALLHDVGKIGVDDSVLKKEGTLTDEEFNKIKEHPVIGGKILDRGTLKRFSEGAMYHHERYDGSGYCSQLKEQNIPLTARIIAVADVYDAMVSDRIYRKSLGREKAIEEINRDSGKHFDPKVVEAFNKILDKIE